MDDKKSMIRVSFVAISAALIGLVVLGGCDSVQVGPAPITVPEYEKMARPDRNRWPDNRIMQINLTRISNSELFPKERLDSLALVRKIASDDGSFLTDADMADMATLLRDPKCPSELNKNMLLFLLELKYPDLAAHATAVMQNPKSDPELRKAVVDYWGEGSEGELQMLTSIVQSWAKVTSPSEEDENSFRKAVKKISGKEWDVTLLDELNSKTFQAKGDALRILSDRLGPETLRKRILSMHAETEAMEAIQGFFERFDYLPTSREELITAVMIYGYRRDMLSEAARLALNWSRNYKYQFNIRDFHLLSRLSRDPLRSNLKRTQIVLEIGQTLKTRKHVRRAPAMTVGRGNYKDNFWLQVDKLTMSDLWNLFLINEMLSRPRVQVSLRLMADGDMDEISSAWGGLVFYQNGQAEASIYPFDSDAESNDMTYQATRRLITDERDSLCRFIGHFEKVQNDSRAGPSVEELADAKVYNYYGLILTRVGKNSFCAHYYNPDGVVISLGKFPLR